MLSIVTEAGDWICGRIGAELSARIPGVSEGCPRRLYVPYYLLAHKAEFDDIYGSKSERDIALFTHMPDNRMYWDLAVANADHCIAMSAKTASLLPREKTSVVKIPPAEMFRKGDIVLGVSARQYKDGRKRMHWAERLASIPGIAVHWTGGTLEQHQMPDWYRSIDYLLVLGDNEGGPMPVVEALAMGKPVIAPDVGWAWEYPCLHYDDYDSLEALVRGLVIPANAWDEAAREVERICMAA